MSHQHHRQQPVRPAPAARVGRRVVLTLFPVLLLTVGAARASAQADPHHSFDLLVSGNGHTVLDYNSVTRRTEAFLEHTYRYWDENVSQTQTRDFCYDTYFGVRVGASSTWLTEVPLSDVSYVNGTGVIHTVQDYQGLTIETFRFAPFALDGPGGVMLIRATNNTGADSAPVSFYSIHNFHLGSGRPDTGTDGESIVWDAASDSYSETGNSGAAMVYLSLGAPTRHACSPNNPYPVVQAGGDLVDTAASGVMDDAVAGFQQDVGALAPGASASWGVALGFAIFGDVPGARGFLQTFLAGRDAETLLADEIAGWNGWRHGPPPGLTAAEQALWNQSEAILRMGQVREGGLSHGGVVASLPPGNWNIVWVRDMAYAVTALARTGHLAEARAALEFQLGADSGYHQAEVGYPYQISITRYYGMGKEETDYNQDGPNIEFDGFGLFLWTLSEYHRAGGDNFWHAYWDDTITTLVADVLVNLQDPQTGLISADSSIWEVHWNGMQKRFTYTSLTAARGLCAAAELAQSRGEQTRADGYRDAARSIQTAVVTHLVDGGDVLGQSYEELQQGMGYLDAAVVEAVNFGLIWPESDIMLATFDSFDANLVPPSQRGYMRNDDGGWYDSQEWVFVDLRSSRALRWAGRSTRADALLDWVTAQAGFNYNLIAELHDENTADYAGEVPMVGFGAGGYLIAMGSKAANEPATPCCTGWAYGPGDSDAGVDAGVGQDGSAPQQDGGQPDGGGTADAGTDPPDDGDGCGCRSAAPAAGAWWFGFLIVMLVARRRRSAWRQR
ncbi:MAG: glycoside hydrolase family 15 protein [bacterium]